ncbi:hypothetical protein ACWGNN_31105 [Streptomyces sp. NPDC055817]
MAYAETVASLQLAGPVESDVVGPKSVYEGGQVKYSVFFDKSDGMMDCGVVFDAGSTELSADLEKVAVASGAVERSGGLSDSARSLKQMKMSLAGQAEYIRLVHPFLAGDGAAEIMRAAGAREWDKGA